MSLHDFRLGSGKNFIAITLSDSNDVFITDTTITDKTDENLIGAYYPRGFHCSAAGTIYVDDASGQLVNKPITLTAGTEYHYSFKRFRSTGASGITHGNILAFR